MNTTNLSICQKIYDNLSDDNSFLSTCVTTDNSVENACNTINNTHISLETAQQIELVMVDTLDGCDLLTRILHAALNTPDFDQTLINQVAEFAVEGGVL